MNPITITTISAADIPDVIDLILAQQQRQHALDPRLTRPASHKQLETTIVQACQSNHRPLVALDRWGCVRGYVQPSVWSLAEPHRLRAFFSAHNGLANSLALPAPDDPDTPAVLDALVTALTSFWRTNHTTGDLIRWPSNDLWLTPHLARYGFILDSVCALHPPTPSVPSAAPAAPSLTLRLARPEDEDALVALLREELLFHEVYTPFVHARPEALRTFRAQLQRTWAGAGLLDDAPLVIVVEYERELVAMAETSLMHITPEDQPNFTPPGQYACIDNVSVLPHMRGKGVGRLLVQAIFAAFAASEVHLDGSVLWYTHDNPLSSGFWPHMQFLPLWTTYQRFANASSETTLSSRHVLATPMNIG